MALSAALNLVFDGAVTPSTATLVTARIPTRTISAGPGPPSQGFVYAGQRS